MYSKKEKGDIGLTKVISYFTEKCIHVSLPISEHLKYDLIAEKNGVCKRIQVKFTTAKNGILNIKLKSVWSNKKGNHILKREIGDFDVLAIYSPTNDKVYLIDDKNFDNSTVVCLRIEKSHISNQHTIRYSCDYEDYNKIWKRG